MHLPTHPAPVFSARQALLGARAFYALFAGFMLGAALQLQQARLWPWGIDVLGLVAAGLALVLWWVVFRGASHREALLSLMVASGALGFFATELRA